MIQLHHVHKRYDNGKEALIDVTLRVREAEFVFLTGASGAGKSTLLRLLLVMERVTEGQVLIGGRNVHLLRDGSVPYLRRNIGLVFQDFRLIHRRSVFANVAIAMEILGLPRAEVERRVMHLLAELGLGDRAGAMPGDLSGGERQRVALARALANEPAILLADEPTGNLDLDLSVEIMDLLLEINRRGTTVVVATHDYALVRRYGLRTVALDGGRVVEDRPRTKHEPPGALRASPAALLASSCPSAVACAAPSAASSPLLSALPSAASPAAPSAVSSAAPSALGLPAALRASPRIQPGARATHRPLSAGFSAANVRLPAVRITGPIRPGVVASKPAAPEVEGAPDEPAGLTPTLEPGSES